MCNLLNRNQFQTESRNQVDEVTNQFHSSRGIPSTSLNFILCQEYEKVQFLCFLKISQISQMSNLVRKLQVA